MYKLPNNSKWSQTNKSDLFWNIYYTKSINFDEEGYLKLSSRSVSLLSEETDTNFDLPTSFGKTSPGDFYIATTDKPYILDISDGTSSLIQDTDNGSATPPTLAFNTYGKWWVNRWHVTTDTKLYYKTVSNGDWTDTGITALTTSVSHPIEAFEKSNTLMVGNGNAIRQLNTSYATTSLSQLTISSDYEIVGLAYNNNILGIATRLSSTAQGQDKEAMMFTWDGSASSANSAYYCGANSILDIKPYKSSFVLLNSLGELKYFNGGGFDTLGILPSYSKNCIWGDEFNKLGYGDIIKVDGDLVYMNINSNILDSKLNTFLENQIAGIWCYDPAIGLYHKQAPSITKATIISTRADDVNTTTNTLTVYTPFSLPTSPTIPDTGNPVKILTTTIGGLTTGKIYYVIKVSPTEFKLATTKANAIALSPVDITSTGANSYFMMLDVKDYGISRNTRVAGVSLMKYITNAYDGFIFGGDYYDTNSASTYANLLISVSGFKNIGYFVTAKIPSTNIEDNIQKVYLKYKTLDTNDSITLKYKNKDVVDLPQYADCTATSSTVFTTTSPINTAFTSTDELEFEVLSGAGAGQMVKVSSITESGGTYTITLEDELEGVSASDVCYAKIDNWIYLDTITVDDSKGWKEIPLAQNSKFTKLKVILAGSDVTIEEIHIVNDTEIKSQ